MKGNEMEKTTTLYYREGGSDKIYTASIIHSAPAVNGDESAGYVVRFAYGRRGATLTTGTKTTTPVDHATAQKLFNKLIAAKEAKGYTEGADSTPYQNSAKAGQVSGLKPQLLNTITSDAVPVYLDHPGWMMQEKFDGRRLMIRKTGDLVEGINKLGLVVDVPQPIVDAVRELCGIGIGSFALDGEIIGDVFHAFDVLGINGDDLRGSKAVERYDILDRLFSAAAGNLQLAKAWTDPSEKRRALAELKARGAEGVVFKRADAPYRAGRPASGGTQLKFKFVATLSARVAAINKQRSVTVALLDDQRAWQSVGNVTIPANAEIPEAGDVVEVRYLYAHRGGSLYQPVFLGVRDDIKPLECVVGQLKYKANADA